MRLVKKILETLYDNLAIRSIASLFDGDEHRIISKRGLEILNENENII